MLPRSFLAAYAATLVLAAASTALAEGYGHGVLVGREPSVSEAAQPAPRSAGEERAQRWQSNLPHPVSLPM